MTELQIIKRGIEELARELMDGCHARIHECYGCDYLAGRLEGILSGAKMLADQPERTFTDRGPIQ